jgi:hypothetical protein
MLTSGLTAIATTSNTAVTVISNANNQIVRFVRLVNTSSVAGFFSIDNGISYAYLPASATVDVDIRHAPNGVVVLMKRVVDGSNVTGVFAYAW